MNASDERRVIWQGKYLTLVQRGTWECVERHGARGAVMIAACTATRDVIFVEQFRIPLQSPTIEWPAGLFGDDPAHEHETEENCARREMLEETGFAVDTLSRAFHGSVSAGMSNEHVAMFVATTATRVHAGGGIAGENITVHVVPLATVHNWLAAQETRGCIIDVKIFAGLYAVERALALR